MLFFWLIMSIAITFYVTVKCFLEGFQRWWVMYLFSALAALMFFVKRSMMKRYDRHFRQQKRSEKL